MADCTLRQMGLMGFRSLYCQDVNFDNPTFIVGRNGSGKSNFADAFAFLSEAMVSPLQAVIERRGRFLCGVASRLSERSADEPHTVGDTTGTGQRYIRGSLPLGLAFSARERLRDRDGEMRRGTVRWIARVVQA